MVGPVADSDEELIELVQILGAYAGLTSRPFDTPTPSSTCACPMEAAFQR